MLTELEKIAPPTRRVLFAVEVIDGVSGATIYERIKVEPLDGNDEVINGRPLVNRSGKFVWTEPNNAWPVRVRVGPDDKPNPLPFERSIVATPRPDDPIPASKRLFTVVLRPTAAYPFGAGVTAVRGSLREGTGNNARAIKGALVQFARVGGPWKGPAPGTNGEPSPGDTLTDAFGEFAVYLRLAAPEFSDVDDGRLPVALRITRKDVPPWDVPGEWSSVVVGKPAVASIPVGQLFNRDVTLRWPVN
ncbi:hypothetical protein [Bradyrhizobium sp. USDA 3315]